MQVRRDKHDPAMISALRGVGRRLAFRGEAAAISVDRENRGEDKEWLITDPVSDDIVRKGASSANTLGVFEFLER